MEAVGSWAVPGYGSPSRGGQLALIGFDAYQFVKTSLTQFRRIVARTGTSLTRLRSLPNFESGDKPASPPRKARASWEGFTLALRGGLAGCCSDIWDGLR